jgi:hypothetical protein
MRRRTIDVGGDIRAAAFAGSLHHAESDERGGAVTPDNLVICSEARS